MDFDRTDQMAPCAMRGKQGHGKTLVIGGKVSFVNLH